MKKHNLNIALLEGKKIRNLRIKYSYGFNLFMFSNCKGRTREGRRFDIQQRSGC